MGRLGPAGRRFWLTVVVLFGLGYLTSITFRSIDANLAHPLMEDLGLDTADVGLIASTYVLGFAAAQVPLGLLLDSWARAGPRPCSSASAPRASSCSPWRRASPSWRPGRRFSGSAWQGG